MILATASPPIARGALLYALAAFGAHVAYAPLLSLLLPRRIVAIAPDRAGAITSVIMLLGGLTASVAHIWGGRIGDRWRRVHGNRRVPIMLGLGLTVLTLIMLGLDREVIGLTLGLIGFQIALNLMFAPVGAVLVDHFADQAKGRVAALANLAMPLAALGTGAAAFAFPHDGAAAFIAVAGVVTLAIVPMLVIWPFAAAPLRAAPAAPVAQAVTASVVDWVSVGLGRMLMQSGAAFMSTYFYLFVTHHPDRIGVAAGHSIDRVFGGLVMATTLGVMVVAVMAGQWSDRHARRRAPMVVAAIATALALALSQGGGAMFVAGYAMFQICLIAYLALDTALVAQMLHASARPGEMLGYMNLSNTMPAIIVPSAVLMWSGGGIDAVWVPGTGAAALGCLIAAGLIVRVRAAV